MVLMVFLVTTVVVHVTRVLYKFRIAIFLVLTTAHYLIVHTLFPHHSFSISIHLVCITTLEMTDQSRIFSIAGRGLKLNTKADIEPHLQALRSIKEVEEVHFGGNTLGVEACEALSEVLVDLKSLKVRIRCYCTCTIGPFKPFTRSPISRISSLVV